MIIKGSARGQSESDTARLAKHLLAHENESVSMLSITGTTATTLPEALQEMRLMSLGTRTKRGLYHASINLDREEAPTMTAEQWLESVDELERRLGMEGHQRAIVQHVKRGRQHIHIVWCRVHLETLKLARDSHNYKKHEECSRHLEERFALRPIDGAFTRKAGTPRPVARATHSDWQAQERTGVKVEDVASILQQAWASTKTGQQFKSAIERQGLTLAQGYRGIIVVDGKGTPHSIPRRLQIKAGEVTDRLASLNIKTLPTVETLKLNRKNNMNDYPNERPKRRPRKQFTAKSNSPQPSKIPPSPDYWTELGYQVETFPTFLLITLSPTTTMEDHGDHLTLNCPGEPSDEDIRLMVEAGKAKGWQSIRFYGGSPEFQKRARLEALRQGYPMEAISLECEDNLPKPAKTMEMPMPDHIRKKLQPEKKEESPIMPTAPEPTLPVQEFRI